MSARNRSGPLASTRALLLLYGLAGCTGSSAHLTMQPDFAVMTPTGIASVSIRQSPPGMTDTEFRRLVRRAMERTAPGLIIDPVQPPFPSQRIVWHVNPSVPSGMSQLVVNVFEGANPFANEQETITDSEPRAVLMSTVASLSQRLLIDLAARAKR